VQLVTIVALAYVGLLEGAVLIETVFSWPGFGQYMTNNMLTGDAGNSRATEALAPTPRMAARVPTSTR